MLKVDHASTTPPRGFSMSKTPTMLRWWKAELFSEICFDREYAQRGFAIFRGVLEVRTGKIGAGACISQSH